MKASEIKTSDAPSRFKVGDRVRVRNMPNMFYTRTQMYVRGVIGTIAARTYKDLIPEDEAWNYDDRVRTILHRPVPSEGSLGRISIRQRYVADRVARPLA